MGVQLDAVGIGVGIGRKIATPITGVYFSLDDEGSVLMPVYGVADSMPAASLNWTMTPTEPSSARK